MSLRMLGFTHALFELTDREYEILNLLAQGQNNAVIAKALALSPKTVANSVSTILSKLQVADRAQVMLHARHAGDGASATPDPCPRQGRTLMRTPVTSESGHN